jgi:transcriptional regulator with XRE-family HTH domain
MSTSSRSASCELQASNLRTLCDRRRLASRPVANLTGLAREGVVPSAAMPRLASAAVMIAAPWAAVVRTFSWRPRETTAAGTPSCAVATRAAGARWTRERQRARRPGCELAARPSPLSEDVWVSDDPWKAQLEALGALLRAQRTAADLSLRELSERTRVSNAYLSQLERGLHEPSLGVLRAIASALGVPLASLLTRAGVLESGEGDGEQRLRETEAAILRDPELSEPQRTALLSVYRSFVAARPSG